MFTNTNESNWRKWVLGHLVNFDASGDGVYASSKNNPINATLTTNPYGYSATVLDAIQNVDFSRYPLPDIRQLSCDISDHHGLSPNEVLVGAGIDGLIAEIIRGLFSEGDHLIMPAVTFPNAAFITRICGGAVDLSPMRDETFLDLNAMGNLLHKDVKAIYIANPNNPTGEIICPEQMIRSLYQESSILIVDEANIEFGGESCMRYFRTHPNMIILRTFSKGYGLAGFRVGYACGNPELLRLIDRSRPPFPISSTACAAARAALADQGHLKRGVSFVKSERTRLVNSLKESGFSVFPGSANSILCHRFDHENLVDVFDNAGITVADGKVFGLSQRWCRIAPQKAVENDEMIRIIKEL